MLMPASAIAEAKLGENGPPSSGTAREGGHALPASPYLTAAEAATYLRFRSSSGIRTAVWRGELQPSGIGPKGAHMFRVEDLDCFLEDRLRRRVGFQRRHAAPGGKGARNATEGIENEISGCEDGISGRVSVAGVVDRSANWTREGGDEAGGGAL